MTASSRTQVVVSGSCILRRSYRLSLVIADTAGAAGDSFSGEAEGGNGGGHGPGGNAYTGATGKAHGGDVINDGGAVDNEVDMTCEPFMCWYCDMSDEILILIHL